MDKWDLQQLKYLNLEIKTLKKQIADAEYEVIPNIARDRVKGSSVNFPYCARTFAIVGVDYSGYERRVRQLKQKYKRQLDSLMDKVAETYKYIEQVPDGEIRIILQLKFINRLTWEQIESETGINERTARRKFKTWWNK